MRRRRAADQLTDTERGAHHAEHLRIVVGAAAVTRVGADDGWRRRSAEANQQRAGKRRGRAVAGRDPPHGTGQTGTDKSKALHCRRAEHRDGQSRAGDGGDAERGPGDGDDGTLARGVGWHNQPAPVLRGTSAFTAGTGSAEAGFALPPIVRCAKPREVPSLERVRTATGRILAVSRRLSRRAAGRDFSPGQGFRGAQRSLSA